MTQASRDSASAVHELIEPSIEAMGFRLVRTRLLGGNPQRLEIMAEREDGSMTIDDCATLSETVSAILDVEDPISGQYLLEVSSPGLDRPLTRLDDYARFKGYVATVKATRPIDGRRRFRGTIEGSDGETIRFATDEGKVEIGFGDIESAKLVITDDMLKAKTN
jgi:ribosome maturation factor RimP